VWRAEQNSISLSQKLSRKGFAAAVIEAVITDLTEQGLVNDERYADLYARSRIRHKAEGPRALRASLLRRHVTKQLASESLSRALDPETELELLNRYIKKKIGQIDHIDARLRSRLKFEGFSGETIELYGEQGQEQ
jgi:regulatory protein